ncbi:MAG: haloacid dehalogenase [Chloroflexi bacterium]|nr:haloacid dehalogenase [Chloroflexota bacterium]
MSGLTKNLDLIAEQIRTNLTVKDAAREKILPLCRETIRYCSESIRATHRHEFREATQMLLAARKLLREAGKVLRDASEMRNIGAFLDAQKEFAEGRILLAMVTGKSLPPPDRLGVDSAAYLNGLGEAVGELRRYLLDSMRNGDLSRGEDLLAAMDDIYSVMVTMDFPDAITGGLRRTTDMVRGVLERTRSDLTLAIQQKSLEQRLEKLEKNMP